MLLFEFTDVHLDFRATCAILCFERCTRAPHLVCQALLQSILEISGIDRTRLEFYLQSLEVLEQAQCKPELRDMRIKVPEDSSPLFTQAIRVTSWLQQPSTIAHEQ
jgi:hypothetical protein